MAVALMGGLAGGMGFIFTGGDKATANKIWAPSWETNMSSHPNISAGTEN